MDTKAYSDHPDDVIQIDVACEGLVDRDVITKSDPFCMFYVKRPVVTRRSMPNGETGEPRIRRPLKWNARYWGITEVVDNDLDPHFLKKMVFRRRELTIAQELLDDDDNGDAKPEVVVMVRLFDFDGDREPELHENDYLGLVEFKASDILSNLDGSYQKNVSYEGDHTGRAGTMTIRPMLIPAASLHFDKVVYYRMQWRVEGLPSRTISCLPGGSCRPFLLVSRRHDHDGVWLPTTRTAVLSDAGSSPLWQPIIVDEWSLCRNDLYHRVRITLLMKNRLSKDTFVGAVELKVADLLDNCNPLTPSCSGFTLTNERGESAGALYPVTIERIVAHSLRSIDRCLDDVISSEADGLDSFPTFISFQSASSMASLRPTTASRQSASRGLSRSEVEAQLRDEPKPSLPATEACVVIDFSQSNFRGAHQQRDFKHYHKEKRTWLEKLLNNAARETLDIDFNAIDDYYCACGPSRNGQRGMKSVPSIDHSDVLPRYMTPYNQLMLCSILNDLINDYDSDKRLPLLGCGGDIKTFEDHRSTEQRSAFILGWDGASGTATPYGFVSTNATSSLADTSETLRTLPECNDLFELCKLYRSAALQLVKPGRGVDMCAVLRQAAAYVNVRQRSTETVQYFVVFLLLSGEYETHTGWGTSNDVDDGDGDGDEDGDAAKERATRDEHREDENVCAAVLDAANTAPCSFVFVIMDDVIWKTDKKGRAKELNVQPPSRLERCLIKYEAEKPKAVRKNFAILKRSELVALDELNDRYGMTALKKKTRDALDRQIKRWAAASAKRK